ncbi:hypothetical protein [Lonepinella sp. MS14437]|uniref:hypothetical protein n=1 Tax=Lonepinella sp. MS14437 TaxID=3003620 RepID=UPI0036DA2EA8
MTILLKIFFLLFFLIAVCIELYVILDTGLYISYAINFEDIGLGLFNIFTVNIEILQLLFVLDLFVFFSLFLRDKINSKGFSHKIYLLNLFSKFTISILLYSLFLIYRTYMNESWDLLLKVININSGISLFNLLFLNLVKKSLGRTR